MRRFPASRTSSRSARAKAGVARPRWQRTSRWALARHGGRVGIIDGNVYGPNVPIMLGLNAQLSTDGKKIIPAEKQRIRVVSMGFLTDAKAPIIWRSPMLYGVVRQFFRTSAGESWTIS